MAKEYFEKLSGLVAALALERDTESQLEIKHFFSGAALYSDGQICASWSPVGLAFKLPDDEANALIATGEAMPLRYFPNGHIKKRYALFKEPEKREISYLKTYFVKAVSTASN